MLALTETNRLAELEAVIDAGFDTYIAVGQALATIKDERLYLNSHTNFRDYLQDRFGISRSHGYNLINAAAAAAMVGDEDIKQTVALHLNDLPVGAIRLGWEVVKGAAGGKPVTTALVKSVVRVLKTALLTDAVDTGDGSMVDISNVWQLAVDNDAKETLERQKQHIADKQPTVKLSGMVVAMVGDMVTVEFADSDISNLTIGKPITVYIKE